MVLGCYLVSWGSSTANPSDVVICESIEPGRAIVGDDEREEVGNGVIIVRVGEYELSVPFRVGEIFEAVRDFGAIQLCVVPRYCAKPDCENVN